MEKNFKQNSMKQYILKYQDFLNEALTPQESEIFGSIQVVDNLKSIHSKIFGDTERIYIPFDFSYFNTTEKSKIQEDVEEVFANSEYEIISYEQNQCRKKNDKNITKIGKVLNSKLNKPELVVQYGKDVEKSRSLGSVDNLLVCISRNPTDIASMSTDRSWISCQNVRNGSHKHYVSRDIKQGSIIAYLIKSNDKEILDPESRVLIKPFVNSKNVDDVVLLPATKTYFRGKGFDKDAVEKYPKFYDFVVSWCSSVQADLRGVYNMNTLVYPDGDMKRIFLNAEDQKNFDNPKTEEDFKFISDFYDLQLDFKKIVFENDGLITYNGDIYLRDRDFRNVPKFLNKFRVVKGDLDLGECPNLRNFKGLENLEEVVGFFNCSWNPALTSFEGLKNLVEVGGDFNCDRCSVTNFKGLDSLEFIWGRLSCSTNTIQSFEGLETLGLIGNNLNTFGMSVKNFKGLVSLKKIENVLECHESLESFEGLDSIETLNYIDMRNNKKIKNFKGLETLETIEGLIICSESIESFEGLEKCEINHNYIQPREIQEKYKVWKENLKK